MDGKKAYELSLKGLNAREIADKLGEPYDNVRQTIKYYRNKNGKNRDCRGLQVNDEKHSKKWINGTYVFDDIIQIEVGEQIDAKTIMEQKGLNPDEWEVVSFVTNSWEQHTRDGETVTLFQSKLTVKPKKFNGLTQDDVEKLYQMSIGNNYKFKPIKYKGKGTEIAEICCADLHCGLFAWAREVGKDGNYDLQICSDKFLGGIRDIVDRCKQKKLKEIYFVTLGDVVHIDNSNGTTTKGTRQDYETRPIKIIEEAVSILNTALEMLREVGVPINYVYLRGNHDEIYGWVIASTLKGNNPDINFDIEPNPQKAIHFGKVLVGLSHGDMPKYNKGTWIMNDYRREFGESDFVEEHCGHIHTEEAKMYNGVMVRSCMAQCGNSYWEHQQGYRSTRGIMSFIWDENIGLRETWYYYY